MTLRAAVPILIAALALCESVRVATAQQLSLERRQAVQQKTQGNLPARNVASPDGRVNVRLELIAGVPTWHVAYDGRTVLARSRLGIKVGESATALGTLNEVGVDRSSHRQNVKTTWGKCGSYDDHFQRFQWTLREAKGERRSIRVVFRVYDCGVALRYVFKASAGWGESFVLADDNTEFCFAEDHVGWAHDGENDPRGPQPLSAFLEESGGAVRLPLVLRRNDGLHLAVMEGALFDHAPFELNGIAEKHLSFRAAMARSTLAGDSRTSWRVLLIGSNAGDLLVAPIPYCLNPPCKIADTSWVKPGLALWDWRAWGAKGEDGFTYGLDMPSWRRSIDFAARNNVSYLVLDAGWYGLEFDSTSDPRTSRDYLLVQPDPQKPGLVAKGPPKDWADPIDVPALIQYGKAKGVGIFLYFNDLAGEHSDLEGTLALYHQWGAAGIKYGFMKGSGQQKVLRTRKIVELCAKYELHCNFHDNPVPPTGDRRTWPNYLSREFCHSQSDAMRVFSPSGFCEQVFVNMLAGPVDMCNGLYTLKNPAAIRPKIFTNVNSTIVAETARIMIVFSGVASLPDSADAYAAHPDLFDFLSRLPMNWDETRILHGEVGRYVTTARRKGKRWFIASATNEKARTLTIKLDFLPSGQRYSARLYEDAPDAHYITNREAYQVRTISVQRGDFIDAVMAPGGGHCIFLEPRDVPDSGT